MATFSDYFPCNAGVRQSENLSPLLFAIYLNDFHGLYSLIVDTLDTLEIYLKFFVLLYVDDKYPRRNSHRSPVCPECLAGIRPPMETNKSMSAKPRLSFSLGVQHDKTTGSGLLYIPGR